MRAACSLAIATLLFGSNADAHAFLARAVPPVGSTVSGAPSQMVLTFSEGVEALFSTIELRDAHGKVVPIDKPQSPPGNNRQLIVQLPTLAAGGYTVIWHATSVDTHKTDGSYQFTVK